MKFCYLSFFLQIVLNLPIKTWCFDETEKIHLTDSWAVHIESGNDAIVNDIAEKHGFQNIGQVKCGIYCYNFECRILLCYS